MKRVTLRLPNDIVDAFDAAGGNRSALMREVLTDHVAEGNLTVPDRLEKLARAERAKQRARWDVKDAGLRGRAYRFVKQRWSEGTHDPHALERALTGFRDEASASEDDGAESYINAMAIWFRDNWPESNPANRPDFPDAAEFHDGVPGSFATTTDDSPTVLRAKRLLDASDDQREAFKKLADDIGQSAARTAIALANQ